MHGEPSQICNSVIVLGRIGEYCEQGLTAAASRTWKLSIAIAKSVTESTTLCSPWNGYAKYELVRSVPSNAKSWL